MIKTYFADANIFLRFVLEDNLKLSQKAKGYFTDAREGKIKLVFTPEIIMEITYVLLKVYSIPKTKAAEYLSILIRTHYLEILNREILLNALEIYQKHSVDFVDALLYSCALESHAEVLSFDVSLDKAL